MKESSRPIFVTVVIPHDVRLSIAEIQAMPPTSLGYRLFTSKLSTKKHLDSKTGLTKPYMIRVKVSSQPSSIEKIMKRPLSR